MTATEKSVVGGVTHVVGRAGSGKTASALRLIAEAEEMNIPAAYYRMVYNHSWTDALQEIGIAICGRDNIRFPALGTIFENIPVGDQALILLDDYRHHTKAAGPEQLREQVAGFKQVSITTYSLPHPQLPNPVHLAPLTKRRIEDLGDMGDLTGGWAGAAHALREILEESDAADREAIKEQLASRMHEARAVRLLGRQKPGALGEAYLLAMARVGVPARVREVAESVGRSMTALGPCRSALLRSGVIYMPRRGWVDFSCPFHQAFLRRSKMISGGGS